MKVESRRNTRLFYVWTLLCMLSCHSEPASGFDQNDEIAKSKEESTFEHPILGASFHADLSQSELSNEVCKRMNVPHLRSNEHVKFESNPKNIEIEKVFVKLLVDRCRGKSQVQLREMLGDPSIISGCGDIDLGPNTPKSYWVYFIGYQRFPLFIGFTDSVCSFVQFSENTFLSNIPLKRRFYSMLNTARGETRETLIRRFGEPFRDLNNIFNSGMTHEVEIKGDPRTIDIPAYTCFYIEFRFKNNICTGTRTSVLAH
ncbi:MAG: hypothetical protein LCH63_16495 [Candidatus Melainabacteria bacterium]|nr:hypothetical protein [Candidatus Melainabacteria bacterium]